MATPRRQDHAPQPEIRAFFDEPSNTASYLLWDAATRQAAVIDSILAFDAATGKASAAPVRAILDAAAEQDLQIVWALETHLHADHLSGASYVKAATGAKTAIGEHIGEVQRVFRTLFNVADVSGDGAEFDRLLRDGERLSLGRLDIEVLHTPGHTPACVSYRAGDAVFVGDTLLMPDYGTARTDFPGGDARQLFRSIRRLLALPPATRLFLCHDYGAPGRDGFAWETTVLAQRQRNVHVRDGVSEEDFAAVRTGRDKGLSVPRLLLPSVQVNIRAGRLPPAEANGMRYLKLPITLECPVSESMDAGTAP